MAFGGSDECTDESGKSVPLGGTVVGSGYELTCVTVSSAILDSDKA